MSPNKLTTKDFVKTDRILETAREKKCIIEAGGRHMKIYDPNHQRHVAFVNCREQSVGVAHQIWKFFAALGAIVLFIITLGKS